MNFEKNKLSFNAFDKILLFFIASFLTSSYIFWFTSNVLRTNLFLVWILVVPASFLFSGWVLRSYTFEQVTVNLKNLLPYFLLLFFLTFSLLFLLEPILSHPYAAIGIPNKDSHDGIAAFIGMYGYPPLGHPDQNDFIPKTVNEAWIKSF